MSELVLTDCASGEVPPWRLFTDAVMGGVSEASAALEEVDGRRALRLRGRVRLENRGGFIQLALALGGRARPLDATRFRGVRLTVRGSAPGAFVHLRTRDTLAPWAHYAAAFEAGDSWASRDVPFERFSASGTGAPLDRGGLLRIGIVAGRAAGVVDLAFSRVVLYDDGPEAAT